LKTINTLTGFKWIGEKLAGYEAEMKAKLFEKEGLAVDYDACDIWTKADLMQDYSTYFVFGGEESYGYLATDKLRDKDANAAVVMFCELAAYLKAQDMTFPEYLDSLYLQHGYYEEKTINIYYEGAAGSQKIANILESYRSNPPKAFGDVAVSGFTDFGKDEIIDADGKKIPPRCLKGHVIIFAILAVAGVLCRGRMQIGRLFCLMDLCSQKILPRELDPLILES